MPSHLLQPHTICTISKLILERLLEILPVVNMGVSNTRSNEVGNLNISNNYKKKTKKGTSGEN